MSAVRSGARYPAGASSCSPFFPGSSTNACPGFSPPPFPCCHTRAVFPAAHRKLNPLARTIASLQCLRPRTPCAPTLRASPPTGDAWLHEIKFDGWPIQLHKRGRDVTVYTKNGHDYTKRLPVIAAAVEAPPARSAIIDGELTATDEHGLPDFGALHFRKRKQQHLCVWAFDLLELNGRDLRGLPLTKRKASLKKLLNKTGDFRLRFSESFDDGVKLLAHAEALGLEGIVSKGRDRPYRSVRCNWIKMKCRAWREANKDRHQLFKTRS
jgi:bifunctional non-homologous end joining protein LigD